MHTLVVGLSTALASFLSQNRKAEIPSPRCIGIWEYALWGLPQLKTHLHLPQPPLNPGVIADSAYPHPRQVTGDHTRSNVISPTLACLRLQELITPAWQGQVSASSSTVTVSQSHRIVPASMRRATEPHAPHSPGQGESSQCFICRIFLSLDLPYASSQIRSYLAISSWN